MCESFNPGITVRRPLSITRVAGPRKRRISSSGPVAMTFPPPMAIASTNEGIPFVAILALCNISSADTAVSLSAFPKWIEKGGRHSALDSLLVSCSRSGNRVLGKFCGRRTVHHGVRVLDADAIRPVMVFHDVHHCIV